MLGKHSDVYLCVSVVRFGGITIYVSSMLTGFQWKRLHVYVRAPYPLYFRGAFHRFLRCKLVIRGCVCGLYSFHHHPHHQSWRWWWSSLLSSLLWTRQTCTMTSVFIATILIGIHSFLLAFHFLTALTVWNLHFFADDEILLEFITHLAIAYFYILFFLFFFSEFLWKLK